jgi:hypothetical protein
MTKPELDEALRDWVALNKALMLMDEANIQTLLAHEKAHRARLRVMLRLYHRLSKLRATREKAELGICARG